jgi:hypothetical protein
MGMITTGPLEGLGSAIVVADVTHELADQVQHRGEDPVGNDLALDPGEPVPDLVEPGGVRRGVGDGLWVRGEELLNPRSLMRRGIVGNEMSLLATRLVGEHLGEESDKLLDGVARRFCLLPRGSWC